MPALPSHVSDDSQQRLDCGSRYSTLRSPAVCYVVRLLFHIDSGCPMLQKRCSSASVLIAVRRRLCDVRVTEGLPGAGQHVGQGDAPGQEQGHGDDQRHDGGDPQQSQLWRSRKGLVGTSNVRLNAFGHA